MRDIAVDRLGAVGFLTRLQEHGLPVAQFGQGFVSMSAPCKEIERAILERQFKAGGDPILRWNIANIRVEPDAAGNIKFAKHKSVGQDRRRRRLSLANEAGPHSTGAARLPERIALICISRRVPGPQLSGPVLTRPASLIRSGS